MGLCQTLPNIERANRSSPILVAQLQLASAPRQPTTNDTHQPTGSADEQPVEAPHLAPEWQDAVVDLARHRPAHPRAAADLERVLDDLGLLLDPVALQRPARLDRIVVAAEGVAH